MVDANGMKFHYFVHMSTCRKADVDGWPFAGIIWSGRGAIINLHEASCTHPDVWEFLVMPRHDVQFANTDAASNMIIFTVYAMIM